MRLLLTLLSALVLTQAIELTDPANKQLRIVNGFPAAPGQFPYHVEISRITPGPGRLSCDGSLISAEWVLTAAYCFHGTVSVEIFMGMTEQLSWEFTLATNEWIIHPQYDPATRNNDIALIALPMPVSFSQRIQPIALPSADRTGETFVNTVGTVSGLSLTDTWTLGWVNVRVISNAQCMLSHGPLVVLDSTICGLGAYNPNQGPCWWSGSPLAIEENGQPLLIGVYSLESPSGCDSGLPAGYTRITHLRPWITMWTGI